MITRYWKYKTFAEGYREVARAIGGMGTTLNTGVYPSSNTKIQIKFTYDKWSGGIFIGGYSGSESDSFRFFRFGDTTYLDFGSGDGRNRISGTWLGATIGGLYEAEIGNRYVKDLRTDTVMFSNSSVSFAQKSYPIQIFGGADFQDYGSIYYCKIYEGSTLVKDLVPCERVSDGNVGLWDKVNNEFIPSVQEIAGEKGWQAVGYVTLPATPDDYDFTTRVGQALYKPAKYNFVTEGSIAISADNIASGFDTTSYIRAENLALNLAIASSWEIYFDVTVEQPDVNQKFVYLDTGDPSHPLLIGAREYSATSGRTHLWMFSPTGTLIRDADLDTTSITPGSRIKGRLAYSGNTYTYSVDRDDTGSYTQVSSFTSSTKAKSAMGIMIGYPLTEYLRGTANLNNWRITVNGNIVWEAVYNTVSTKKEYSLLTKSTAEEKKYYVL